MKKAIQTLSTLTISLVLIGCGSLPEVNQEAVANYQHPKLGPEYDGGIYIIRPNNFVGGGRDFWVAVDDKVIGDIENNSYVFIPTNSKENLSANTVMNMALWSPINIKPNNTNTARFKFYKISTTEYDAVELEEDAGVSAIATIDKHELDNNIRVNDGYDNLAMNPAQLESFVSQVSNPQADDVNLATVYIFRNDANKQNPSSIWFNDNYEGELQAKQFIKVQLAPGTHNLLRRDNDFHNLEINVEAGQSYAIQLSQSYGWTSVIHKPTPINLNNSASLSDFHNKLKKYQQVEAVKSENYSTYQSALIKRGQQFMKKYQLDFTDAKTIFPNNYSVSTMKLSK